MEAGTVIQLKPGVDARVLTPQIVLAITIAHSLWDSPNLVITSLNEGVHNGQPVGGTDRDPHYLGLAVDLRLPLDSHTVDRLREALGAQYVVLKEATHVHVQFGHSA